MNQEIRNYIDSLEGSNIESFRSNFIPIFCDYFSLNYLVGNQENEPQFRQINILEKGGAYSAYINGAAFYNFGRRFITDYISGEFEENIKRYEVIENEVNIRFRDFLEDEKGGYASLSNEDLVDNIKVIFDYAYEIEFMTIGVESVDEDMVAEFVDNEKLSKIIQLTCIPTFLNFDNRVTDRLIEEVEKSSNYVSLLDSFSTYTFVPDKEYLQRKLNEGKSAISNLREERKSNLETVRQGQLQVEKERSKLSDKENEVLSAALYAIRIRDERKVIYNKVISIMVWSLNELVKRLGLDEDLPKYVNIRDLNDGAEGLISKEGEIMKRRNGCIYSYQSKANVKFILQDVEESIKDLSDYMVSLKSHSASKTEIKGSTGNIGKVSGIAKVILSMNNARSFLEGDVLVTSMTRPEFVPLMKKASAIITDEGGITSHAAIISREMKKPCIIGTKIATQVLSDGDVVEVDADNGVVRII